MTTTQNHPQPRRPDRRAHMALKKIEHAAPKKQTMTLNDLTAFVQDALRSGATGDETIGATVSFGGKIQKLTAEVQIELTNSLDKA